MLGNEVIVLEVGALGAALGCEVWERPLRGADPLRTAEGRECRGVLLLPVCPKKLACYLGSRDTFQTYTRARGVLLFFSLRRHVASPTRKNVPRNSASLRERFSPPPKNGSRGRTKQHARLGKNSLEGPVDGESAASRRTLSCVFLLKAGSPQTRARSCTTRARAASPVVARRPRSRRRPSSVSGARAA